MGGGQQAAGQGRSESWLCCPIFFESLVCLEEFVPNMVPNLSEFIFVIFDLIFFFGGGGVAGAESILGLMVGLVNLMGLGERSDLWSPS